MIAKKRTSQIVSGGSMADIAFLLLIFFMLTTTIVNNKGIDIVLPPKDLSTKALIKERNLFTIILNANGEFMVEGEHRLSISGLRNEIIEFILNPHKKSGLSSSPQKAIVSIKTSRGASYSGYIDLLDEVKAAYFEIYARRVSMDIHDFRQLSTKDPRFKKARQGIPMNISLAEPF